MLNTGLQEILSKTARLGLRGSRGVCRARSQSLSVHLVPALSRGLFFFGETKCRNGEMNTAGVTIAEASIGLSVRPRAIAVAIADGQRPTVGSDSRRAPWAGAEGA
jgi:hypothetical protein